MNAEISRLVQLFASLSPDQRRRYSEDDTKANLIEPLFKALGWPMDDEHEVQRNRRGAGDQPDYTFRINNVTQFFLEAKPLREDLDNLEDIKQAIRYAFNKGVAWAVLTNFQRLIVFDAYEELATTTARPRPVLDLTSDRYPQPDTKLALLTRDTFPQRRLEEYAVEIGARRRPIPVEQQLYEAMRGWREALVNTLVIVKRAMTSEEIFEIEQAVQRLLDRLMFLRNCEDRGIGNPRLRELYHDYKRRPHNTHLAQRLERLFAQASTTYDSELFDLDSYVDLLLPQVGDQALDALGSALEGLYEPPPRRLAPYDFKEIGGDVLGRMYEQYLGHVARVRRVRVTQPSLPGMAGTVEIAPLKQRRKEQGIYYTPKWVVDYIVGQTLGAWLREHGDDSEALEHLAVLDPACGSGSFLIRAYETLLEHEAARTNQSVEMLSRQEREHILRRNIHGVDLDNQAVEIARLNLLLRMVREEEKLPELKENVLQGNSLIAGGAAELRPWFGDAWEGKHLLTWETTFREVMGRGGFDVVIGNPPYIRTQSLPEQDRDYYRTQYKSAHGSFDIYVLFIERALSLLKEGGRLGFITSGKFLKAEYGKKLLQLLQVNATVEEIVDLSARQVFGDATTYPVILVVRKGTQQQELVYTQIPARAEVATASQVAGLREERAIRADQGALGEGVWPPAVGSKRRLLEKILAQSSPLGSSVEKVFVGLQTSADDVFVLGRTGDKVSSEHTTVVHSKATARDEVLELDLLKPLLSGHDIQRYSPPSLTHYLLYPYIVENRRALLINAEDFQKRYPLAYDYLIRNRQRLENREGGRWQNERWYEFGRSQNLGLHEEVKIAVPRLVHRLECLTDLGGKFYLDNVDVNGLLNPIDPFFLTGLLNSKLLNFCFIQRTVPFRGGFLSANRQYLEWLPIKTVLDRKEGELHDRLVAHVTRMLELHRRLGEKGAAHDAEREALERQVQETDRAIDELVYDLYGLTAAERRLVEEELGERSRMG